jgi:signal transduction histidine kinase
VRPPTELPDEGLVNKSFSLGSSIEGEWGGYLAFSSVIALILVAALLLGGSVLLIQVRRNSLEAVRKTTFVSNVSHELKTPLTTIRMYGEMLGDGIVKDEAKRKGYLETIISESQRLTRLVNNVLDFGRLERGEKTYNWEEVELGSAVGNILETQRPRLEEAGLELEWMDDSQGAVAKLDPDVLEQVLLNLLDNLVKYAAGGKYASVRLAKDAELVILEVSDHGPGIPSEQRERIFETFHRVDDSLTSNKPGCGIGLGIARKLVEDMGGQITCEANEPKGARFRIEFPQSS